MVVVASLVVVVVLSWGTGVASDFITITGSLEAAAVLAEDEDDEDDGEQKDEVVEAVVVLISGCTSRGVRSGGGSDVAGNVEVLQMV